MSVLNQPVQETITPAKRVANQIVAHTRNTFQNLVSAYNGGSNMFWRSPLASPQEIAAELGADAAEIFSLHAKIGALLGEVKPESVAPGLEVVGQFTVNADGTVTIPQSN